MTSTPETHARARASQKRIPEFFIVGHAKCGTTALYEMLRRHPQIYLPEYDGGAGKEPWFFSRENPQPQTSSKRSIAFTGRNPMTLDQYLSLFAAAQPDQRIGEASTSYLWSPTAAERIAETQPDARIIAILREPASFLRSLHLQLLQNHHEVEGNFRKAVALDDARREDRHIPKESYWPQALIYSDRVRYVEQLRRYGARFSPEQMLVLIYDDFRSDNEATVRRVLRFLDVEDTHPIETLDVNPTIGVRSARLHNLIARTRRGQGPVSGAVKTTVKTLTPWKLRARVFYPLRSRMLYGAPAPPDESFMAELRSRFKPEVVALSDYLDRDLVKLWGYDDVPDAVD
jgi:Sulfotransferase family